MNETGVDNPISHEAKEEIRHHGEKDEEEAESELDYLVPSRWWFASTAFPLMAGTFGPMASAFSVCALVENWRVQVPEGGTEEHGIKVADTSWLIAINAISLFLALLANLSLLLNMARRIPFPLAQPITIIGWYLSSALLIALVSAAVSKLPLPIGENRAFSQAFYYAIIAAALYFFVASLMMLTVYGAYKGHYSKEFRLTIIQRTLMLQTISFLLYLLCGAAVYAKVEDWNFLDAVYFADFTLLTVGIGGDLTPKTHLGRGLLYPYAIGGIVILGLVVGSIRSLVLERGKKKMGARMVEKHRKKALKKMYRKGEGQKLIPIRTENGDDTGKDPAELERRRAEFDLMRDIQSSAARNRRWTSLIFSSSVWFILWFVGAAVFQQCERNQDWSYFQSTYFAYTSLLTIGYGDFFLMSNSGKPFFVFWSLCAVPSLTILISNMGDTVIKMIRDATIWVGNISVLPGEHGVMDTLKAGAARVIRRDKSLSGRRIVDGMKAEVRKAQDSDMSDEESAKKHSALLRESREYAHYVIAREICTVLEHLTEAPAREYTYEEWTWYLELIGEDEASAATHRAATEKILTEHLDTEAGVDHSGNDGLHAAATSKKSEGVKQWSWLEHRSPLMGDLDEASWVLNRLTSRLRRELKAMYDDRETVDPGTSEV